MTALTPADTDTARAPDAFDTIFAGYGTTHTRLRWQDIPHEVRSAISADLGAPPEHTPHPVTAGFHRRFAGIVQARSGRRVFVVVESEARRVPYRSLVRETRVLSWLAAESPAPRVLWTEHVIAGGQRWHIRATEPLRVQCYGPPKTTSDVRTAHDMLATFSQDTALLPASLAPRRMATYDELAPGEPGIFAAVANNLFPLPAGLPVWTRERARQLAALERRGRELPEEATCHLGLRPDRMAKDHHSGLRMFGWSRAGLGPAWADWTLLLMWARGVGVDSDAWLRNTPLARDVDPDDLDAFLTLVAARALRVSARPSGGGLAYRGAQTQAAAFALNWIGTRRSFGSPALPTLTAAGTLR